MKMTLQLYLMTERVMERQPLYITYLSFWLRPKGRAVTLWRLLSSPASLL